VSAGVLRRPSAGNAAENRPQQSEAGDPESAVQN
jgi:hypothetical protein